jgi:hypothetical protein
MTIRARFSLMSAFGAMFVMACSGSEEPQEGFVQSPASDANVDFEAGGDEMCGAPHCLDIHSDKDISFIAIEALACLDGPMPDLTLYEITEDGLVEVTVDPQPHGQGQSCEGIPPSALKFEGLNAPSYSLCVTYPDVMTPGDVTVWVKSGQTCQGFDMSGDCAPCQGGEGGMGGSDATTGAGGSDATTGAGGGETTGSGGSGGHGGDDGNGGHGEGGECP